MNIIWKHYWLEFRTCWYTQWNRNIMEIWKQFHSPLDLSLTIKLMITVSIFYISLWIIMVELYRIWRSSTDLYPLNPKTLSIIVPCPTISLGYARGSSVSLGHPCLRVQSYHWASVELNSLDNVDICIVHFFIDKMNANSYC